MAPAGAALSLTNADCVIAQEAAGITAPFTLDKDAKVIGMDLVPGPAATAGIEVGDRVSRSTEIHCRLPVPLRGAKSSDAG